MSKSGGERRIIWEGHQINQFNQLHKINQLIKLIVLSVFIKIKMCVYGI